MHTSFLGKTKLVVFDKVYEPSDDSFLLTESIEKKQVQKALDLGTGSGIQGINAALLGAKKIVSTDISETALDNAKENAKAIGLIDLFEFRKGSLFSCIENKEKFDLIIFNPPYVESKEIKYRDLDGGKKGREILDLFLKGFKKHLEKEGSAFFLQSTLNGIKETERILEKQGLKFEEMGRKKLFFEELVVFRVRNENK